MPMAESCLKSPATESRTILVVGAGRFGARAVRLLGSHPVDETRILVVDNDEGRLSSIEDPAIETFRADGVDFLVEYFAQLHPHDLIVPAVPVHVAAEWLKKTLSESFRITPQAIPGGLETELPNTWRIGEDILLTSYADFLCPEDCGEPEYCTVSGEKRDVPMRELLKRLKVEGFSVHVVASAQLAPGLGGYEAEALNTLKETVISGGHNRKWLVATACNCHGVLSAFEVALPPLTGTTGVPIRQ